MSDYKQPSFYHFSEDSLLLAYYASEKVDRSKSLVVGDFCAGSGVVGLEFSLLHPGVNRIDFIEGQKEFISYLRENIQMKIPRITSTIMNKWLSQLDLNYRYDVILCNPPYFKKNEGRKSANNQKQICRTFEKDSFDILYLCFKKYLKKSGIAFFLGRENLDYKKYKGIRLVESRGNVHLFSFSFEEQN